jgi:hypothetical protein
MVERVTITGGAKASAPLWAGLLLAAAAWSAHLLASHFLVEASCSQLAGSAAGEAGRTGVRTALLVVTLAAAVFAMVAALVVAGRGRLLERRGPGLERSAGLAPVIAALSWFFVLLIILEAVPLLLLGCGAA